MTTERDLISHMVAVIADAYDECLDGMNTSAREKLMDLIREGNAHLQQAAMADANAPDYIGDGSPAALAANLRRWVDSVPSHARPLLVAAADALVAPVAPAEPVATLHDGPVIAVECWKCGAKNFDRAPVAPALVPLTKEQIHEEWFYIYSLPVPSTTQAVMLARAVERLHRIKP